MSRRSTTGPTGLVVVDKEAGWTSHDVVAKLRGVLRQKRTGHAGTLDPSATGVLLVGLGKATRLMTFLQSTTKRYEGTLVLGSTTTTLDADGEVTATFEMGATDPADVAQAAASLTGDILQIPPMVSAIKIGGRRLHEAARAGEEVERAPRPVRVDAFEVTETADPLRYDFTVVCSSGTYVRSLADDLGRALGGGAHLGVLRRTHVGSFSLAEARTLTEIEQEVRDADGDRAAVPALLSPAQAMRDLEAIYLGDEESLTTVSRGRALKREAVGAEGDGPFALLGPTGELLAVYVGGRYPDDIAAKVVLVEPAKDEPASPTV